MGLWKTPFTAHGKAKVRLSHILQTAFPTAPGYLIRAPTGQRTAQTLTTEYRRAAEVTQRGDTAFHIGRFFMRRRPFADRLLSACRTAADAAERIYLWHFSTAQ